MLNRQFLFCWESMLESRTAGRYSMLYVVTMLHVLYVLTLCCMYMLYVLTMLHVLYV